MPDNRETDTDADIRRVLRQYYEGEFSGDAATDLLSEIDPLVLAEFIVDAFDRRQLSKAYLGLD